jgi:WXXGXW repeat (2 copies)
MNCSILTRSLLTLSFLALTGCTVEDRIVVRGPRPADRIEVITAQPSPQHVWIRGRWETRGAGWEWVGGRWERQ